jgi:hypothetical protein
MHQDSASARIGMYGKGIIVGMHQDSASTPTPHPHDPCPYTRASGTQFLVEPMIHHHETADWGKEL